MTVKRKARKAVVTAQQCVACGCCVPCCPRKAICIEKGVQAKIEWEHCVGCGICSDICPASVVRVEEV